MRRHRLLLLLACLLAAGCTAPAPAPASISLTSSAFAEGGPIPVRHTCDGEDLSPPLQWTDVPAGVVGFALIVTDPDAGGFVHWTLDGIPGEARSLEEGRGDEVGHAGDNDFGGRGWRGPCPPSGEHRYVFTLYALSAPLEHGSGVKLPADQLRYLMEGKVVATGELTGTYSR